MTGWIAIALGDVTGIGPEVTLKALAAETAQGSTRYLLIGDEGIVRGLNQRLGLNLALETYAGPNSPGRICLHNPLSEPLAANLEPGSPSAARAAIAFITDGAHRCLRHEMDALVTAPLNKLSIVRSGLPFIGQTEYLARLAGVEDIAMMLLGEDDRRRWLRVALATTHISLKTVASHLRPALIERAINLADRACRDLQLPRRRIAVCGLNPHAGEGGEFGDEEITTVEPAVHAAQKRGLDVTGPLSADALFYHAYRGDYDAVVAMYHDQGLIPLKMVAFEKGVNWTLGLPFIRTSPDHGTAYDIAGQGKASPSSMIAAMQLARQLAANRDGNTAVK